MWQCCGTVTIFYGSGSGSTRQKVTVPTVPVPVPQHWKKYLQKVKRRKTFFLKLVFCWHLEGQ
jgi:hypothetical protein